MKKLYQLFRTAWFRWAAVSLFLCGIIVVLYSLLTRPHRSVQPTLTSKLDGVSIGVTPVGTVWLTPSQVVIMERMYTEDTDVDVAKTLLQHYISQWNYAQWRTMLVDMYEKKKLALLDQNIVQTVIYNAAYDGSNTDLSSAKAIGLDTNLLSQLLRSSAREEYDVLTSLLSKNPLTSGSDQPPLLRAFHGAQKTYSTLSSAPSYYFTGLLAAALMENGYTPFAQGIASTLVRQHPDYILAHEILFQSALIQQQYSIAQKHLESLITLDRQHIQRTSFFLWLVLHAQKKYSEASLFFSQVQDPLYLYDAMRYQILIAYYDHSYDRMMDKFRLLLQAKKTTPSDHLLLYDIVFYEPYHLSQGSGSFDLAQKYALSVIVPYIDSCKKNISPSLPYVCKYGEAWRYLSQWKREKAYWYLIAVSKKYPNPRIYQALWDYYLTQWNKKIATSFYKKALLTPREIVTRIWN
jgi:tetratricopeptide (TPR) repeat protein